NGEFPLSLDSGAMLRDSARTGSFPCLSTLALRCVLRMNREFPLSFDSGAKTIGGGTLQWDDSPFSPRQRRGFSQLQRFYTILQRRPHGFAIRQRIEEVSDLERVRHTIALEKEVLRLVFADAH